MKGLALVGHVSIYVMVCVVLVSGVLMMDRPISVFGLFHIPQPLGDPTLIARYFTLHIVACVMLSLLLIAHISAVIVHELIGDRILRRMVRPQANLAHPKHK